MLIGEYVFGNVYLMGIKSFLVILVLSLVVNFTVMSGDALIRGSFLAGEAGLPLRFDSSSMFGGGSINYLNLTIDIFFWFIIILGLWKLSKKVLKR